MTNGQRYARAHITRRADALLAHALTDLGERGTLDLGYTTARGTRRVWRAGAARPESVRVGIGYALHAGCTLTGDDAPTMHYAYASDRNATQDRSRSRGRVGARYGRTVRVMGDDGKMTTLRDIDSGRAVVGAIADTLTTTGVHPALLVGARTLAEIRHAQRIARDCPPF